MAAVVGASTHPWVAIARQEQEEDTAELWWAQGSEENQVRARKTTLPVYPESRLREAASRLISAGIRKVVFDGPDRLDDFVEMICFPCCKKDTVCVLPPKDAGKEAAVYRRLNK